MDGDATKKFTTLRQWKEWTKRLHKNARMKYRLVSLRPFKVVYAPR